MNPKTGDVAEYDVHAKPTIGMTAPEGKPDPTKNPRFLAMESLAKRHEAERQQEMADDNSRPFDILHDDGSISPGQAINETPAPVESAPLEPPVDASPVETAKEAIAPQVQEPEEERELIVDGKTIKVPLSKIIDAGVRTFQKETAADLRLASASRLEQQARERFQQPQGAEFAQSKQQAQPQEDDAALAHAIQFGTEDQAKDAIAKLRNAGRGTSSNEVQGFVQQNVMQMVPELMKFQDANTWARNEYKEIFADPMLEQQFMLSENARRQNGDARPHRELYKELGDTMLTKFNLREATPETIATPQEGADRLVRKANSPRPVQAAGGQKPPAAPVKNPTVTDYVEKQRQLRGLTPMPRRDQSI